ncbi:MAG: LysM peptidoglycan-binding domain-containing protein, partial [Deltaproteobacteria bacterium]|nr:LysM peptidoglycan-binding domain-containing protein [Deltaproteobacteria bacterium]
MPKIVCIPIIVIVSIIIFLPSVGFCDRIHKVRRGETLAGIANIYFPYTAAYTKDELIRDIKEMNGIELEHINVGQQLRIPVIRDAPVRARRVRKPKTFVAKGVYINKRIAGSRQLFSIANEISIYGANTIVFDAKDVWGCLSYKSSIPHRFSPSAMSFNA